MQSTKRQVFIAFMAAVFSAFIIASISHTQFVLNDLSALGIHISVSTRLATTRNDLIGLASGYLPIILIGLLLGFSIMGWFKRRFNWNPLYAYPLAGGLTFAAIHWLMYPIFYITLIAGARSTIGFSFQCLAGVVGGLVFAKGLSYLKR